jgi:glycosyltransferase involved in cell wall biosynthesis
MSVRDEAQHIVPCLAGIVSHFAEIVVIDTGSTDDTCALLRDELGIEPMLIALDPARCGSLADARNQGFDSLKTPWLMTLDADERIDPAELAAIIALDERDLPAGLFCAWDTDYGDGAIVEDYKLNLFRSHHRHVGLIHDTAQPSLRIAGEVAEWQSLMRLKHFPGTARREIKEQTYNWRLDCAMECEPDWLRYHWFAGYTAQRRGELDVALPLLRQVHTARPKLFPVESLNASMVLAGLAAQQGKRWSCWKMPLPIR